MLLCFYTKTLHFSYSSNKKATLEVLNANRNDTGIFSCIVDNGVGDSFEANVTLIVRSKPQVDRSQVRIYMYQDFILMMQGMSVLLLTVLVKGPWVG